MSEIAKKRALRWISENESDIIEVSGKIWGLAELGLQEFKSSALLAEQLKKAGFNIEMGVAGMPTAFVATWGSGSPVIGIMGEYDALAGLSQKTVPWKEPFEEGSPGHGCGHNIHGSSGMAGAIAAKVAMEEAGIRGTIKFFGTPAEETAGGKVYMVRDGFFNGLDAVLSHHAGSMNTGGYSGTNAENDVKFHFYGIASHAAGSPEQGRSALDAVELTDIGVNYLREHVIQEARMHYVVTSGGEQPNVVPAYASSWYYVRAPERDQVEQIYNRVLQIAKGAAMMTETTLKAEFVGGLYNMILSRTLNDLIISNMRQIGLPTYNEEEEKFAKEISKTIKPEAKRDWLAKSKRPDWETLIDVELDRTIPDTWERWEAGSTDVSDVSWQVPTLEFTTATFVLGSPGHSWQNVAQAGMRIGHKSLIFAAKTMSSSVIDLMSKPDLVKKAKDEFKQRLEGRVYKSPLPPDMKPALEMWKK
jgi:aminobenzoyl-glutamate utilization protein B